MRRKPNAPDTYRVVDWPEDSMEAHGHDKLDEKYSDPARTRRSLPGAVTRADALQPRTGRWADRGVRRTTAARKQSHGWWHLAVGVQRTIWPASEWRRQSPFRRSDGPDAVRSL